MIRKTYFILNRLLISLNPFCLNACINSFTCLRASIYKSIWNTITAIIVAFKYPSYPPVIIEQISAISIRIVGMAHIITL